MGTWVQMELQKIHRYLGTWLHVRTERTYTYVYTVYIIGTLLAHHPATRTDWDPVLLCREHASFLNQSCSFDLPRGLAQYIAIYIPTHILCWNETYNNQPCSLPDHHQPCVPRSKKTSRLRVTQRTQISLYLLQYRYTKAQCKIALMLALTDMASSPQYFASSAHTPEHVDIDSNTIVLPDGSCANTQPTTLAYSHPDQNSYSGVSTLSPSIHPSIHPSLAPGPGSVGTTNSTLPAPPPAFFYFFL